MPVMKLDLIFECNGRGWRETYYRNWESQLPGAVLKTAQTLAAKRAALSGKGVQIKAYSITDPLAVGRQGESVPFNPRYEGFELTADTGAVGPSVAVNILWADDITRLHRRQWMRGVWDLAIHKWDQMDDENFGSWMAEFAKYREYVLAKGFGWLNRPRAQEAACSYTYNADEVAPTFTFATAFFDAGDVGKFQSVRFSKFNGSNSPLNRELVVRVVDTTHCVAALPIAAGPMTTQGKCIRYGTPTFVAATNIGVGRVGRRAPGAPLLHTPGRSKARARS